MQGILGGAQQWFPTYQDYLSNATGLSMIGQTYSNDTQMVSDARAGKVQFTFAGPVQYLCLALAGSTSDGIAELVSSSYIDGQPVEKLAGAIVVNMNSPISTITDLHNKVILTGPSSSLTTFAAQWSTLQQAGVSLFSDTRAVLLQQNITSILPDLAMNIGDAAFVPASYLERFYPGTSQFRVINSKNITGFPYQHSTPLYPNAVLSTLDTTPFNVRRAVAQALFDVQPTDKIASEGMYYGFTSLGAYTQVRTLMASLGLLDNATQCRSISSLYDLILCPPGYQKINAFASRCSQIQLACPPTYQCVCSPCQVIPTIRHYLGLTLAPFAITLAVIAAAACILIFIITRLFWLVAAHDPLEELMLANATIIGRSSTGPIFATTWQNNQVAVKRLSAISGWHKTIFDSKVNSCTRVRWRDAISCKRLLECFFIDTAPSKNIKKVRQRMQLHHSNIMPILGFSRGQYGEEAIVIMPRMMAGTISDLLASQAYTIDLQAILSIAQDVANAMNFFHNCEPSIIGKNVKPHHLFLDESLRTIVGVSWRPPNSSSLWAPPECMKGAPWSKEADVYAYSMLLYTLVTRKPPFEGKKSVELLDAIKDADEESVIDARPPLVESSPLNPLIQQCWAQNPSHRPSFEDIRRELQILSQAKGPRPGFATTESQSKTEGGLLEGMFPEHVMKLLKAKKPVPTESFPCVTIFFSDIKGFTSIASVMQPSAVKSMLNNLYTFMDTKAEEHHIHKLETIGDGCACFPSYPFGQVAHDW